MEILDFTEMRPNERGEHCNSGSIAFGVSLYSKVEVTFIENEVIVVRGSGDRLVVEHFARVMKLLTGYRGGFEFMVEANPYVHQGLGGTASLASAVVISINAGLGSPFGDRDLVKIAAWNYVESGPDGKLYPGQSTGASGWIACKGGFSIVSSDAELAFRHVLPEGYTVMVGVPQTGSPGGSAVGKGVAESYVEIPLLEKLHFYDRFNSAKTCHWTLMRLIPAVIQGDLRRVGDLVWDMMVTNPKGLATVLAHQSCTAIDCLCDIRNCGAEVSFVSAVGPAIVTLTSPNYTDSVRKHLTRHGYSFLALDLVDRGGIATLNGGSGLKL